MRRALILALFAVLASGADARAQSQAAFGLGVAITTNDPTTPLGQSATSIGPLVRIKMGTGLGPSLGFDWYAVSVNSVLNGERVFIGRVAVKPLMGGLVYNWNRHKYWVSASVVGGYAFADLDFNDRVSPALRSELRARYLSFDTLNSLVWRPQLGIWYDAAPRVGISASIAYIGVWPKLRVSSDVGTRDFPLDARCAVLTFGLVYGVF